MLQSCISVRSTTPHRQAMSQLETELGSTVHISPATSCYSSPTRAARSLALKGDSLLQVGFGWAIGAPQNIATTKPPQQSKSHGSETCNETNTANFSNCKLQMMKNYEKPTKQWDSLGLNGTPRGRNSPRLRHTC